jgi:hypothetical protein
MRIVVEKPSMITLTIGILAVELIPLARFGPGMSHRMLTPVSTER